MRSACLIGNIPSMADFLLEIRCVRRLFESVAEVCGMRGISLELQGVCQGLIERSDVLSKFWVF